MRPSMPAAAPSYLDFDRTLRAIPVVAMATGVGFLVAQEQFAARLATWLASHSHEKWLMLLTLNLGFFLLAAVSRGRWHGPSCLSSQ